MFSPGLVFCSAASLCFFFVFGERKRAEEYIYDGGGDMANQLEHLVHAGFESNYGTWGYFGGLFW
jgi:hypothetical protein